MTLSQACVLACAATALNAVTVCVFALRSPSGTRHKDQFAGAAILALATAFWAALALLPSHGVVYSPVFTNPAPTWLAPLLVALLLCSLLLLGYALVKRPRHPWPTPDGR
jgi:protein-S-isoprenylcysteine O-methyltransferase Ste14